MNKDLFNGAMFGKEFMTCFLGTHFNKFTEFRERDVLVGQLSRLVSRIAVREEFASEYDGDEFTEKVEEARTDLVSYCTDNEKRLCKCFPQLERNLTELVKDPNQHNQRKLTNKLYVVLRLANV